jgi:hypothetical protein
LGHFFTNSSGHLVREPQLSDRILDRSTEGTCVDFWGLLRGANFKRKLLFYRGQARDANNDSKKAESQNSVTRLGENFPHFFATLKYF